jgi:hypothetical protein
VIYKRMDGESVLVHLRTDRIFVLNDTAARIWELLQETTDRAEIRGRLLREFDVEPALLEAELETFLADLDRFRLRGHVEG